MSFLPGLLHAAAAEPHRIEKSGSPDGKLELWMKPEGEEASAAGLVEIRETKNGRTLDTFRWPGIGRRPSPLDPPFAVSWRSDDRFFALKFPTAEGWTGGEIYGRGAKGRWQQVKVPADEYTNVIKKLGNVTELGGKGCDRPQEWTKSGKLVLLFADRNLSYDQRDLEKEFLVTLKVSTKTHRPLRTAKVVSIKQRPKEETERDSQKENH